VSAKEASDLPLNIAVQGDEILILLPGDTDLILTIQAARRSARRLLDAVAIAQGRLPAEPAGTDASRPL
jgi:hypothetical protein